MKIWIVSVGEPLPTDGENTRLRRMGNLANCIAENGHQVEWFSVSFDHYKKIQRCEKDTDIGINDNYTMHLVRTNGYKKNISMARIIQHKLSGRNIYKKMMKLEKPDIIIASMEPLEVSYVATKYGIKNSVPVVVDVRDLWPEIYYEVIPEKIHFMLEPYMKMCRRTLRRTMSNAYSIVGLSKDFLDYGLRFANRQKQEKDRVFPIAYPNYTYESYKDNLTKYWSAYKINEEDFLVVFFGNFGKQFEFESIIEASHALESNTKIKFILCGTGLQLEDIKKRTGENVIFPGWIEKDQILSLAANASIGIAPYINSMNYTQNTPNKFGEYLSASLPILVSVPGSMENLINERQCGYRYKCGEELVELIKGYYDDRNKLKLHSQNARELYNEQFNGDIAYKKMLDYLIEIQKKYSK